MHFLHLLACELPGRQDLREELLRLEVANCGELQRAEALAADEVDCEGCDGLSGIVELGAVSVELLL